MVGGGGQLWLGPASQHPPPHGGSKASSVRKDGHSVQAAGTGIAARPGSKRIRTGVKASPMAKHRRMPPYSGSRPAREVQDRRHREWPVDLERTCPRHPVDSDRTRSPLSRMAFACALPIANRIAPYSCSARTLPEIIPFAPSAAPRISLQALWLSLHRPRRGDAGCRAHPRIHGASRSEAPLPSQMKLRRSPRGSGLVRRVMPCRPDHPSNSNGQYMAVAATGAA